MHQFRQYLHRLKVARPVMNAAALAAACSAFIVLAENKLFWSSLFRIVAPVSAHGILVAGAAFIIVTSALTGLFLLISSPRFFQPVLAAVLVLSSLIGFFGSEYGTIIDRIMLQNVLDTDRREAAELLTWPLAWHIVLFGFLPACAVLLVRVRLRPPLREITFRLASVVVVLAVGCSAALAIYKDLTLMGREHKELRMVINPLYPLYSVVTYGRHRTASAQAVTPLGRDARQSGPRTGRKKTVVILVVGETARAQEFSLNGYGRHTNPYLEQDHVISFTRALACGTSTAVSLPCMFSHLDQSEYSVRKASATENILDVLTHAGVDVLWRDNNSGCKGVCARVATEDLSHAQEEGLCTTDECFDEVLLSGLQERLRRGVADELIVLHQKGSHGPAYFRRHPKDFGVFRPECSSNSPEECETGAIVNAYDNTILYTDYFLHRTIEILQRNAGAADTLLVYFSDHGESLGENGLYLHGLPRFIAPEEQTRVPFILWVSDGYARDRQIDRTCLRDRRNEPYSHANIFHSLLGAFAVQTEVYRGALDVFAQCRDQRVPDPRPTGRTFASKAVANRLSAHTPLQMN